MLKCPSPFFRSPPWYEKAFCIVLIVLGTLSGLMSTYVSVDKILQPSSAGLAKPCYL